MITTITMNASIDKAYFMEQAIENGTVMRVASCRNSAGGKGLNVARAVKLCGETVKASGLVGGFNGRYLEQLLDQDDIDHDFTEVEGETRSCINILDDAYGSTEYLEPGCEIKAEEIEKFVEKYSELVDSSEVITISGSVPRGAGTDIYQRLIAQAKAQGKAVILDTSGELLKKGIDAGPTLVKPNQEEIEMILGRQLETLQDVIKAAQEIQQTGIEYVVISRGGDGALLVCAQGTYQGVPPKIEAVNTVGCGDSMVGALAVGIKRGYQPEEILSYAIAVASANALSPRTGYFDQKVCEELKKQVVIEEIS